MPTLLMRVSGDKFDRVVTSLPSTLSYTDAYKIAANVAAEMKDVLRGIGREDVQVSVWAE